MRCYSSVGKLKNSYDVVISGGGMVGFAMACSLGKLSSNKFPINFSLKFIIVVC